MANALNTKDYKAKTILFKEGEKADQAYIIQKGSVKISKRGPSGRSVTIATAAKGGIVGEMAIISDCPRSATVTAIEDVEAIVIDRASFENRLKEADPFLYNLISTVISRLRKTSDHTVALYEKAKSGESETLAPPATSNKTDLHKKGFSDVNFLLGDPNQQTRNSLRSGLFGHGFREILDLSNSTKVIEEIEKNAYDLIMLDTAFGISSITDMIARIRHGVDSQNPFACIVITTENKDKTFHTELMNYGCDMVLAKPLSLKDITDSLKALCQQQRTFVVTRNYAGPDRSGFRSEQGEEAPKFIAPNTMAAKALKGASSDTIGNAVKRSVSVFNEMKMERHLVQLEWLLKQINPENGEPYDLIFLLDQVKDVLDDLTKRTEKSRFISAKPICEELNKLVHQLKNDEQTLVDAWKKIHRFYKELLENMPLLDQEGNSKSANAS